jgi:tripeptide aminopeptidase
MDTVEPCEGVEPVIEDGEIRSAGDTVLGADDKAGVAVIIEVVRRLADSDGPRPPVRVVLTVAEEKGLMGAKALDPADLSGDLALVLDADGDPGGIVVAAPTHYTFAATFHGRAAHAGVEPERGRSAVVMAARAGATMPSGRLDDETTANVGTIQGGSATNVVAQTAIVTGECRSRDAERVEEVRERMQRAMEEAAETLEGRVEVAWTKEYEAFHFDEDDPLLELVEDACRDVGLEPREIKTGGGSDGNILYAKGIPTLVLASGMRSVHGVDEWMRLDDLFTLARLAEAVVRRSVT